MAIHFTHTSFLTSATKSAHFPPDVGREIAFVGRSNAGKSSVINSICGKANLCKVGKSPGKTRLINFFVIADCYRFVDVPGYGYAKVSQSMRYAWRDMMEGYLTTRQSLVLVVLTMDIRHPLQANDMDLLKWAKQHQLPLYAVLTKSDKLSGMQAKKQCQVVKNSLASNYSAIGIQRLSALRGDGIDTLRIHLQSCLSV